LDRARQDAPSPLLPWLTIGMPPTVPGRQTLRAFQEGRDEVLEKAVELLTSK